MTERQVIATWYTPKEKLPEEGIFVVATISGKTGGITFDHALVLTEWYESDGWCIEGFDFDKKGATLTAHAWCDLEPYRAESEGENG